MITICDFQAAHIEAARALALANYNEERAAVPSLPAADTIPELEYFAAKGLGVTALEDGKPVGYLCWYEPWEGAFLSEAVGTFTPTHAHGAVAENRGGIYKRLYQAAAEKLVEQGIAYHGIALYAHDRAAVDAFFTYGFGLRCMDAVRPAEQYGYRECPEISCREISKTEEVQIRPLRTLLSEHLGKSPCFMVTSPENFARWIARAESRDSRVFIAEEKGQPVAFIEITDEGENFATEAEEMQNICGAFCLPDYRGRGVFDKLLNYSISVLRQEGVQTLGVDFESFNPTALGFWTKHFTVYTNSVVRRIDECAIKK